jgi:peptidyl-prolyl cis-trans isomerase A (cyclophilin A)
MKIRQVFGYTLVAVVAALGCSKSNDAPVAGDLSALRGKGPAPADLHPTVVVKTSLGDVTVRLDAEKAPITVDNFLRYAASGQYANTIFHQVDDGFILLGGGYTSDLVEKPTDADIRNEAHNGLKNRRFTLAMSRQANVIDSARCQFFFNLADNPALDYQGQAAQPYAWSQANVATASMAGDGAASPQAHSAKDYGYCVFGEVIAGQDVLEQIAKVPVHAEGAFDKLPVKPVTILSVGQAK